MEYEVAYAEINLSELIDLAVAGEEVIITIGGTPTVHLIPAATQSD